MMRDLKFRVWDEERKEMSDSFGFERSYIPFPKDKYWAISPISEICQYPHLHVMQFTGLRDKNGKEIFEGDILGGETHKINIATNRKVQDSEHFTAYEVLWLGEKWATRQLRPVVADKPWGGLKTFAEMFGVIGDVWENPEFLATAEAETLSL